MTAEPKPAMLAEDGSEGLAWECHGGAECMLEMSQISGAGRISVV